MFTLQLLITFCVTSHGIYGSSFNVSSTTANWTTANGTCFLALPPVTFDGENIRVDDVFGDVMTNNSWLGYFRYGYILQFYGCWNMSGVAFNTTTLTVADCFEYCYSRDKYSVIAVKNTSCYCISNNPGHRKPQLCDQRCPKEGFTCGSTNYHHASVYVRINYHIIPDNDQNNHECLAVIDGQRQWRPCSENRSLQCSTEDPSNSKGDWKTYQYRCPPYSHGNDSWTNTVRTWSTFIHKHTDTASVDSARWVEFGFLVLQNNRAYLEFAPGTTEKQYICQFNADHDIDSIQSTETTSPTTISKGLNQAYIAVGVSLAVLCLALTVFVVFRCANRTKILLTQTPTPQRGRSGNGHAFLNSQSVGVRRESVTPISNHVDITIPTIEQYETISDTSGLGLRTFTLHQTVSASSSPQGAAAAAAVVTTRSKSTIKAPLGIKIQHSTDGGLDTNVDYIYSQAYHHTYNTLAELQQSFQSCDDDSTSVKEYDTTGHSYSRSRYPQQVSSHRSVARKMRIEDPDTDRKHSQYSLARMVNN